VVKVPQAAIQMPQATPSQNTIQTIVFPCLFARDLNAGMKKQIND